jgi:hypothetical protein
MGSEEGVIGQEEWGEQVRNQQQLAAEEVEGGRMSSKWD